LRELPGIYGFPSLSFQVVLVKEGTEYNGTESLIGKTVVAEQSSAGEKPSWLMRI